MNAISTIAVSPKHLTLCNVKAELAAELTREETASLMAWCDCQQESYWDGLSLQEVLNVYRVSAEYVSFEDWVEDDRAAAIKAYNRAVRSENEWAA